jgi:hypothetical protein
LPGWQRDERRKQAAEGSLGSPEKRTKDENEDEDEHDRDMALNTYSYVFSACRRNVGGANKYSLCYLTPLRFDVGRKRRLHDDFHTSCASPESKVA